MATAPVSKTDNSQQTLANEGSTPSSSANIIGDVFREEIVLERASIYLPEWFGRQSLGRFKVSRHLTMQKNSTRVFMQSPTGKEVGFTWEVMDKHVKTTVKALRSLAKSLESARKISKEKS